MDTRAFSTLNELFLGAVEKHDKPNAFLVKSGGKYQGVSSQEAVRKAAGLAVTLGQMGVKRGDRVAILSDNRVEWALTDYAVMGLGAALVPIFPTLLEPDIQFILSDSRAKGIVVSNEDELKKVLNVRASLPGPIFILPMDCDGPKGSDPLRWAGAVDEGLKSAAEPGEFFRSKALAVKPEDWASLIYTSGTTGRAKGVVLTHANLVSNILASQGLFPFASHDVAMSFLPLSHVFERMLDYYYFWAGVSIAYAESFDALPNNLLEVRPSVMGVVPRVLEKVYAKVVDVVHHSPLVRQRLFYWAIRVGREMIPYTLGRRAPPLGLRLRHVMGDRLVGAKVRARLGGRMKILISGAAPLAKDLAEFFYAVGLPVYEGYGLTETSPVIAVNSPGAVKLGTVGRVIAGVEVSLSKDGGEGLSGAEILVRGPNVTPGYYQQDEENRKAFVDGWFHTGDLGALDADGFLTITGRKKNLFKTSGGKYVSSEKLEALFQGHPFVSQMVVIADSRKFVSALIVPNFSRLEALARERGIQAISREKLAAAPEIRNFMQEKVDEACALLPPHERIRQIALVPREFSIQDGELSPTLKIKRQAVEEHFRDAIEEMYRRPAPQPQPV